MKSYINKRKFLIMKSKKYRLKKKIQKKMNRTKKNKRIRQFLIKLKIKINKRIIKQLMS